jgi:hypothetical protein
MRVTFVCFVLACIKEQLVKKTKNKSDCRQKPILYCSVLHILLSSERGTFLPILAYVKEYNFVGTDCTGSFTLRSAPIESVTMSKQRLPVIISKFPATWGYLIFKYI